MSGYARVRPNVVSGLVRHGRASAIIRVVAALSTAPFRAFAPRSDFAASVPERRALRARMRRAAGGPAARFLDAFCRLRIARAPHPASPRRLLPPPHRARPASRFASTPSAASASRAPRIPLRLDASGIPRAPAPSLPWQSCRRCECSPGTPRAPAPSLPWQSCRRCECSPVLPARPRRRSLRTLKRIHGPARDGRRRVCAMVPRPASARSPYRILATYFL